MVLCYCGQSLHSTGYFDLFRQAVKTAEIVPNKYTEKSQQMVTTYPFSLFLCFLPAFLSRKITAPSTLLLKAFYNVSEWNKPFQSKVGLQDISLWCSSAVPSPMSPTWHPNTPLSSVHLIFRYFTTINLMVHYLSQIHLHTSSPES